MWLRVRWIERYIKNNSIEILNQEREKYRKLKVYRDNYKKIE